jgi:hypothetical protein
MPKNDRSKSINLLNGAEAGLKDRKIKYAVPEIIKLTFLYHSWQVKNEPIKNFPYNYGNKVKSLFQARRLKRPINKKSIILSTGKYLTSNNTILLNTVKFVFSNLD